MKEASGRLAKHPYIGRAKIWIEATSQYREW